MKTRGDDLKTYPRYFKPEVGHGKAIESDNTL